MAGTTPWRSVAKNLTETQNPFAKVALTFFKNKQAMVSLIILLLIIFCCVFANVIAPYSPYEGGIADRLKPIGTSGYILGTDEQGRDILSRILYGGRISLLMGFLPVLIAGLIGGFLGVIAGYFDGKIDTVIMRTLDILFAFPSILLAIGLSAAFSEGLISIIIPISVVLIPPIARVTESAIKQVVSEEYVDAAKTICPSHLKVISTHVLPNMMGKVLVYCTTQFSVSLLTASGLSFLGIGISPPTAEWGSMLNSLKSQILINPVLTIIPGTFIFLTAVTVNFIANGFKQAVESVQ